MLACSVKDFVLPKLNLQMKHISIGLPSLPDAAAATAVDGCLLPVIELALLLVLPEGDNPDVLFGVDDEPLLLAALFPLPTTDGDASVVVVVVVVPVAFCVDDIRSVRDASRADTTRNEWIFGLFG